MGTITIGQGNTFVEGGEALLKQDGAQVIQAFLFAIPGLGQFLALPVISWITGLVIGGVVQFIIKELDFGMFAIYVAIKVGKQVNSYITAKQSGNPTAIDQTGDSLINLGDV